MANIYVKSGGGTKGSGSYRGDWVASSAYVLGDRVCGVATSDYWIFECTTAGTSAATEPTWVKTAGSTTASGTATFTARIPSTWADATLTITKATANEAAGDTIYVSNNHAESSASPGVTAALAGTPSTPNAVLCAVDTSTPPTSLATTGSVTTTTTWTQSISGSAYLYGLIFSIGSGANSSSLTLCAYTGSSALAVQIFENCKFRLNATSSTSNITIGGNTNSIIHGRMCRLKNCDMKLASTSYTGAIVINIPFLWDGGSFESGSSTPTSGLFGAQGNSANPTTCTIKNVDFSNLASTLVFCNSGYYRGDLKLIDCKLPASWSGSLVATGSTTIATGTRVSMYNCDSGATNYRLWIETYAGSIKSETTLVKTGGATDGTTPLSWKLASTANANETVAPLITDDMAVWIDTIGASKTLTVDILHDSVTALTDAEIWVEIDYLGSSATPLGTPSSDHRATVLATAAAQTTSSATWTTTGMTNPNKQKLEVTFTPQMKGFVYARVYLAKPSYTVYIDPQPVIS